MPRKFGPIWTKKALGKSFLTFSTIKNFKKSGVKYRTYTYTRMDKLVERPNEAEVESEHIFMMNSCLRFYHRDLRFWVVLWLTFP